MKWDKVRILINIATPLIGICLLIFYEICDTAFVTAIEGMEYLVSEK